MLIPPAGAFVGRAAELAALDGLVRRGLRLITVTGGPGVGKTRFVTEWAQGVEAELLAEGVALRFCDLTEARTIDAACAVLAKTLGATLCAEASVAEVSELLARQIAALGPTLLILDNFEQLTSESARLLDPALAAASQLRVIVTSRERLRLRTEHCLPLEPLAVPASRELPPSQLRSNDSVELFYCRSAQVRADALGEGDVRVVADIVRRLDGIPLAIELCAARSSVLHPTQLLERLARPFELLTRGSRAAHGRHSTLRGAIAWSCELLGEAERRALWQCSVFRGGFSIDAAEAVLRVGEPVLDVLESLYDKSLLHLDEPRAEGGRRFRLLESIRELAADELAEGPAEQDALVRRHAVFFLGAPGSGLPLREKSELANVMAASERALRELGTAPEHVDAALRSLLLLEPFYLGSARGRLEPFARSLDAALAAAAELPDQALYARAMHTRAMTDFVRGRIFDCIAGFQRAVDVARGAGTRVEEGLALTKLALFLVHGDQADAARELFEQVAQILAVHPDPELEGDWALTRGGALIWQARSDEALPLLERAIATFERIEQPRSLAMAEGQRALALLNLGLLGQAEDALERALERVDGTDEERLQGYLLGTFGRVLHASGRFAEARSSFETALEIHRAVGDRWSEGVHLGFAGHLALEQGDLPRARSLYRAAVDVLGATGERHYVSAYAAALAAANALAGESSEAPRADLADVEVRATRRSVRLYSAVAEVAATKLSAGSSASDLRARARAVLTEDDPDRLASRSLDVRVAMRVLQRALDEAGSSAAPAGHGPRDDEWAVGPQARWLKPPGGAAVSLLKSRSLRLILLRLTEERLARGGAALNVEALFRAGWPGERAVKKAAANRVYVALTKLRNLGLRGLLQSREDGFLLDPRAPLSLYEDDACAEA